MSTRHRGSRLAVFEAARRDLAALAYRMLGDMARAEDMVQEAWLRWEAAGGEADDAKAYLVTIVTRLCLNELQSARTRRARNSCLDTPDPGSVAERLAAQRQAQACPLQPRVRRHVIASPQRP